MLLMCVLVAASTSAYDDGRYDYGLSRPNKSYTVMVENGVDIPMRDGKILKGDVYLPDAQVAFRSS